MSAVDLDLYANQDNYPKAVIDDVGDVTPTALIAFGVELSFTQVSLPHNYTLPI